MRDSCWTIAIHGGAGARAGVSYAAQEAHMAATLEQGAALFAAGASALDLVCALVEALEASGLYVAGRGAAPNAAGDFELDAAVMDGHERRAGAVAVTDPERYYNPALDPGDGRAHGTVGCVARDPEGRLAAATSTGGVIHKMPGRVGDSPLIGAGCWADRRVAVSCTGLGEYFIRANVAADVSARMLYARQSIRAAAAGALADMAALGGDGGLIAVDADGEAAAPYLSEGMKRGLARSDGHRDVRTFR
jgi:L-asparaginase/beta-aspartyl-peptidase (threonine type)